MSNVLRVSLPGYNALTDTNPDHFALYTDEDNVLIKEFTRGSASIAENDTTSPYEITHNLGYIPFFIVYVLNPSTNNWQVIPHYLNAFSVPDYAALSDTTKIYITNYTATTTTFKWIIFYDNIVGSSSITLTESNKVVKITKTGIDALSDKDPNNYIFHSDLNTLKIIKEGNVDISGTGVGSYSFAHSSPVSEITSFLVYCKFPDGTTAFIPGGTGVFAKNEVTQFVSDLEMSATEFTFNLGSYTGTYKFKYYIFEVPLSNSYTWSNTPSGKRIAVAKDSYNVLTEYNPDNLKFDSSFNTLKYNLAGNQTVSVSGNNEDKFTEFTIANTWGGVKAFVIYVNSIFSGAGSSQYAFVPHASDVLTEKHEATGYMDEFYLYLKLRVKEGSTFNYSANFYYKIFKNDLGF